MAPRLTKNHSADARLVDAKFPRELYLLAAGFVQFSYLPNLRVVKDGPAVAATGNIEKSSAAGVQHVVGVLNVLKVVCAVVEFVAVLVIHAVIVLPATYWSSRCAEKRLCYKRMDMSPSPAAILVDGNTLVSTAVRLGKKDSAFHSKRFSVAASDRSRKGLDTAVRRNFVKLLKSGDWFPCLVHASNYTARYKCRCMVYPAGWKAI